MAVNTNYKCESKKVSLVYKKSFIFYSGRTEKKLITRSQYLIIRIAEIQRMLHDFATRWELWKKMQKSC